MGPNFPKTGISKVKNRKSDHHHWICILELLWVPNFTLHNQFLILGKNYPKGVFSFENANGEHHHCILHIRITLSTLRCLIDVPLPPPPLINLSKIFHPGHSYSNLPANWFWSDLPSKTIFYRRLLLCAGEIYQ